jgi:hypothetical protein
MSRLLLLLLLLNQEVPLAILVFNRESRRFEPTTAIIDHVEAARILIDVLRVLLLLRCRSSRKPMLLRELKGGATSRQLRAFLSFRPFEHEVNFTPRISSGHFEVLGLNRELLLQAIFSWLFN